jgi:hypothetical protein
MIHVGNDRNIAKGSRLSHFGRLSQQCLFARAIHGTARFGYGLVAFGN